VNVIACRVYTVIIASIHCRLHIEPNSVHCLPLVAIMCDSSKV